MPRNLLLQFSIKNNNALMYFSLLELFSWTETDFLSKHEGSPIRRIGYERWTRNLVVGLGNALRSKDLTPGTRDLIIQALESKKREASSMVLEHIDWALSQ